MTDALQDRDAQHAAAVEAADLFIDHDPMRRAALIEYAVRQAGVRRRDGSHKEARRVLGMTEGGATGGRPAASAAMPPSAASGDAS